MNTQAELTTSEPLWTGEELVAATGGRPVGDVDGPITGVSIDSRSLKPGEAFFAIRGDRFDGHDFVRKAAENGASLAVIAENQLVRFGSTPLKLLVVPDVLEALQCLAHVARLRTKARIIAVTGSVGKTSTKEMLRTLLANCGKVHCAQASYNNHWGVPFTLANMPRDSQFGVFEIGMNHPGEITPLVKMVRPHVGIITTIAPAHLGAFDSEVEIARAKAEIYTGLEPGGYALLPRDNKHYKLLSDLAKSTNVYKHYAFGKKKGAKFRLETIECDAEGSDMSVKLSGTHASFRLNIPGEHMAMNLVGALGGAILSGADLNKLLGGIETLGAVEGRGKTYVFGNGREAIKVIDESYNANPTSMKSALKLLGLNPVYGSGRRIAVLGDMLELGESAKTMHNRLASDVRSNKIDRVWLVGPMMKGLSHSLGKQPAKNAESNMPQVEVAGHVEMASELGTKILDDVRTGDVVMVKASLGTGLGPIVASLRCKLEEQFGQMPEGKQE